MTTTGHVQDEHHRAMSRRQFVRVAAAVGGCSLFPTKLESGQDDPLRVAPARAPSRLVQIQDPNAVRGSVVHRGLLAEMTDRALAALTGVPTTTEAWRSILEPGDVIGLKFNRSGRQALGTTGAFADVLIDSMVRAGLSRSQIVCIEFPDRTDTPPGTASPRTGFDSRPTDFGSGKDQFAAVLRQVTALIDVPFLKTHNIAGMTCALKNLSHGLIKHPARFHGHGCSPFIGDIVAAPPIRAKLRLCLVDALRVAYDGGPEPSSGAISDEGILLASRDPVATDAVGLGILNDVRRRHRLPLVAHSAAELPYLAHAHRRGLGMAAWHGIDLIRLPAE